jgi:hypothetical protein
MLLVIFAIFLTIAFFMGCTAIVSFATRVKVLPNYALVHKRYSYRSEPHADQTTVFPHRLRDNEVTDI